MRFTPSLSALTVLALLAACACPGLAAEGAPAAAAAEAPTTGPLLTDTTVPQAEGTATLFVPVSLGITSGRFGPGWSRRGAGRDALSLGADAQLFYGIAPRTEVYLVVPYRHNWAWEVDVPGPGGERAANFGGLGDVSLAFKRLLRPETARLPAVSGLFSVTFPTGHHRRLDPKLLGTDAIGSGSYTFTLGLNAYKFMDPAKLYANLWYSLSTDATVGEMRVLPRDTLTANLAAELPLEGRWVFLLEFLSAWDGGRLLGRRSNQPKTALISVLPALEFIANDRLSFAGGIKVDVLGRNTRYGYGPIFAVFYSF
jgi:hypothetical protein